MKKIPKHIREEAERLGKELTRLSKDPEVLRRCEEFAKKVGRFTPKDLMKEFTI